MPPKKRTAGGPSKNTRAQWSIIGATSGTDPNTGKVTFSATLRDQGVVQGQFVLTITQDRQMRLEWQAAPGAIPMIDFQAWMKEA